MDIKDLAGLSEPLTKLIEVVSSGAGAISKPYLIRKIAKAKADEIKLISDALNEVAEKHGLPVVYTDGNIEIWQRPDDIEIRLDEVSLAERSERRADFLSRKKQRNIESITSHAAEHLVREETVSPTPLDEDWISTFFSNAENVSTEKMQQLWASILSGEIKSPGSFSLRTLDLMRRFSQEDATAIEKISNFVFNFNGIKFIPGFALPWLKDTNGVAIADIMDLIEIGVMNPTELELRYFVESEKNREFFSQGDDLIIIGRNGVSEIQSFPIWRFNSVGEQVLELLPPPKNKEYFDFVVGYFIKNKASVGVGEVTSRESGGRFNYNINEVF